MPVAGENQHQDHRPDDQNAGSFKPVDVGTWTSASGKADPAAVAGRRARQYCSARSVPCGRERPGSSGGATLRLVLVIPAKPPSSFARPQQPPPAVPTWSLHAYRAMLNCLLPCPRHHAVPRKKLSASRFSKLTLRPVNCARMAPGSGCRSSPFRYWHTCSTAPERW